MSFFIQTPLVSNDDTVVDLFYATTDQSLMYMDHMTINKDEWIAPPVPYACPDYEVFRIFLHPLGLSNTVNPTFAMVTHSFGRTYWIVPTPSQPNHQLRFTAIDGLPPATPHPCKFEFIRVGTTSWRMFNQFYGKYLTAVSNSGSGVNYALSDTTSDSGVFRLHWSTGCGPVAPRLPDATQALDRLRYIIVTRFGKALQWSNTAPYLTVAPINFSSANQQFIFKCVGKPYVGGNAFPFTYNMFNVNDTDNMISFQDDNTFGTRTEGGIWEELVIECQGMELPDHFGRFAIYSNGSAQRLRATSDGNGLTLWTGGSSAPQSGDYFSFLPAVSVL